MKKIFCLIITLILIFSCICACSSEDNVTSSADESSMENSSAIEESSNAEASYETEAELISHFSTDGDAAETPRIVENLTVTNGRVIVSGECENGAVIYYTADGKIQGSENSYCGRFLIEYEIKKANSPLPLNIYAVVDGKSISSPVETVLKYTCFKENSSQGIVRKGTDGWLFFTSTEPQYTNNEHLTVNTVRKIKDTISSRVNELKQTNTTLVYVLVPNPNEIYSEYFPSSIAKGKVSLREEIGNVLSSAGATVIDMRDTLEAHKNDGFDLYHRTDSHWTEYAAYFAYEKLCELFSKDFPSAKARDISEFDFYEEYRAAGDLYHDFGLEEYDFFMKSVFSHIKFKTPASDETPKYSASDRTRIHDDRLEEMEFYNTDGKDKPSFVMMRDSYSIMLFDWLAERAAHSYYYPAWRFEYDKNVCSSFDYVIYFICDMNLTNIIK